MKLKHRIGFKLFAIVDILCAERFELKTFEGGTIKASTKYCNKPCSPSDWHKGGKCDKNGCYKG